MTGSNQLSRRALLQASLGVSAMAAAIAQADTPSPAARNIYVKHAFDEHIADLGEVKMNYAVTGSSKNPALLLIPGQTESWWGFEQAIKLLQNDYQVYAVDLRGQGRSTWTPGRYTLDNMGNDLVRFIATVIQRPVIVSGNSSGGLLSCWLSAYALPGQLRGALYEDPPLWASLVNPLYGHSIRQAAGPVFELYVKYLGDQWRIGDWEGLKAEAKNHTSPIARRLATRNEPSQNLKEYDPEWSRAFIEGTVAQSCPHERMLSQVKVPVLLTHHGRIIDPTTGFLLGAYSDLQAAKAKEILATTGVRFEYQSLPDAAHPMHNADPERFVKTLTMWAKSLPT